MKSVIIIPTYNESGNIHRLIEALQKQFIKMEHEMAILVVDDSSPDGTAGIVRKLQQKYANLHLLVGTKQGLGAAYIRGMRHAMTELGAEVIFEMDGDFSHKPEDVPRLMAQIDHGADVVIGSRYVHGGSIPKEWHVLRRAISMFGNLVARYIAGIDEVRDCTAGFRAIRVSVLKHVDFNSLRVQGYAFQVALLHRLVTLEARIEEIPIDFVDRAKGESKLGLDDILEFIVNAWWIRFESSQTFIRFAIVGASGAVVNLGSLTALLHFGVHKFLASPIAIEISIITNFLLNNYWTFRRRVTTSPLHIKGLRFNTVSFAALVVSYGTFVALSLAWPEVPPQIFQLVGILPATAVNYLLNSYWTFRSQPLPLGDPMNKRTKN